MRKNEKREWCGRWLMSTVLATVFPTLAGGMTIVESGGWLESAYAVWEPVDGAVRYEVRVTGNGVDGVVVDDPLVRQYEDGMRADIPGLSQGEYVVSVRALDGTGAEMGSCETGPLGVLAHNREGFAFAGGNVPGAYGADGTLKDGARVVYVTASTVNTVTCEVADKKGKLTPYRGVAAILEAYGKGYDKTPLAVRIVGTVADSEFEGLKDNNYINLQGSNNTDRRLENVTLEGVGMDATLYGYGVCMKRVHNVEVRNLGIMLFGDDAVSMDTDNSNVWIHNNDFFYGRPGRDSDQVKGDGSIDMKYQSTLVTISYNHFFDSGKVMGCGGTTGEKQNLEITFHHNWFDHADSRCPRLHYTTAHIYNNYYDGVSVYAIGNTTESSAFVEGNYFRNCKRPMMISGQGTDKYNGATGAYDLKGTFSGQAGGMTKAYNNVVAECEAKLVYHTMHATQFDAYLAQTRDEQVPADVVSVNGGWAYSNFDTSAGMYVSEPDAPDDVPADVTAYAGRVCGGDFKWAFDNQTDDESHDLNRALKEAITGYKGKLVAIQGEDPFTSGLGAVASESCGDVEIYDMCGHRLKCQDTWSLPAGVYMVRRGTEVRKCCVRR